MRLRAGRKPAANHYLRRLLRVSSFGVETASLHVNTRPPGGRFTEFMEFLESCGRPDFGLLCPV
jgi:hypothetical protein